MNRKKIKRASEFTAGFFRDVGVAIIAGSMVVFFYERFQSGGYSIDEVFISFFIAGLVVIFISMLIKKFIENNAT